MPKKPELTEVNFSAEMPDGEVIQRLRDSLANLALEVSLTKYEEPKLAVECWYIGYVSRKPEHAVYVGRSKGNHMSWSSCYMFDVGQPNKLRRENLSRAVVDEKILGPNTDLKKLACLRKEVKVAQAALDKFLKANRFDPTGGSEP